MQLHTYCFVNHQLKVYINSFRFSSVFNAKVAKNQSDMQGAVHSKNIASQINFRVVPQAPKCQCNFFLFL